MQTNTDKKDAHREISSKIKINVTFVQVVSECKNSVIFKDSKVYLPHTQTIFVVKGRVACSEDCANVPVSWI